MRIGQGVDVHRFSADPARALWLGLVEIPGERGLDGHSDADVATHALCDAMLGAADLGDLGRHFPDDDPSIKGIASRLMLVRVVDAVRERHLVVENADVTILAERPKLAAYLVTMGDALSAVVGARVSVKATTTEGLGAIGRVEGIAANAVVLLNEAS